MKCESSPSKNKRWQLHFQGCNGFKSSRGTVGTVARQVYLCASIPSAACVCVWKCIYYTFSCLFRLKSSRVESAHTHTVTAIVLLLVQFGCAQSTILSWLIANMCERIMNNYLETICWQHQSISPYSPTIKYVNRWTQNAHTIDEVWQYPNTSEIFRPSYHQSSPHTAFGMLIIEESLNSNALVPTIAHDHQIKTVAGISKRQITHKISQRIAFQQQFLSHCRADDDESVNNGDCRNHSSFMLLVVWLACVNQDLILIMV